MSRYHDWNEIADEKEIKKSPDKFKSIRTIEKLIEEKYVEKVSKV